MGRSDARSAPRRPHPEGHRTAAGKAGNLSQPDEYPVFRMLFELLMTEHPQAMAAMLRESLAARAADRGR